MPLIVAVRREGVSYDPEPFVEPLGHLATAVWRSLGPHFVVERWKVWKGFPSEGLDGELLESSPGQLRPEDLPPMLPSTAERLSRSLAKLRTPLHHDNILELGGTFSWGRFKGVPATMAVNFYSPWAEDNGDITFETFRSGETPQGGLYELLCEGTPGERRTFVRTVLEALSKTEAPRKRPFRIEWAAIKESESLQDHSHALGIYDPRRESSLDTFVASSLRERLRVRVVEKYPDLTPSRADVLGKHNLNAVIRDVGEELEWVPGYTEFVDAITERLGVDAVPAGSTVFVGAQPDSIDRVVDAVADSVEAPLIEAVRSRIDQWHDLRKVFHTAASSKRKRKGSLDEDWG